MSSLGGRGSGRKAETVLVVCPKCGQTGRLYISKNRLEVRHKDRIHHVTRIARQMVKKGDLTLPAPSRQVLLEYNVLKLSRYLKKKLNTAKLS